jgi:hypothetical protein
LELSAWCIGFLLPSINKQQKNVDIFSFGVLVGGSILELLFPLFQINIRVIRN